MVAGAPRPVKGARCARVPRDAFGTLDWSGMVVVAKQLLHGAGRAIRDLSINSLGGSLTRV